MIYNIEPTVDMVFKKILASEENKDLLCHFLQCILGAHGYNIRRVTLKNPYNERDYRTDKLSVVDIKAEDDQGRVHQIEIQVGAVDGLISRILFTWASIYRKLLGRGHNYKALRPVVAIWVIKGLLFTRKRTSHFRFILWDTEAKLRLTDHLDIHILQLQSKPEKPRIIDDKARWLYFLRFGHQLDDDNLPEWLDRPFIRRAISVLKEIRETEETYEQYEARRKGERWHGTIMANVKEWKRKARESKAELRKTQREVSLLNQKISKMEKAHERREKTFEQRQKNFERREKSFERREKSFEQREKSFEQRQKTTQNELRRLTALLREQGILPPHE